jgi:hypothetical protein
MQSVGAPAGSGTRAPSRRARYTRRRRSRRRVIRRTLLGVLAAAIAVVGCAPTLRYLGYLPRLGRREGTTRWEVVALAGDRRSAEIRVDTCRARFDGVSLTRVGRDIRLAVFVRPELGAGKVSCVPPARMPSHTVAFGFALPVGGRILPPTTG